MLPSWTSIHSEGAVSPGLPSYFSSVRSLWGSRHRSPGRQSYMLAVQGHAKPKQAPNAITTLVLQFCVPQFILISTERQHERNLQALLTGSGSRNNFILTWNHKKVLTKPLNTYYSFNFIPQQLSWDSLEGALWSVMTLDFRHWHEWKKVVSTS